MATDVEHLRILLDLLNTYSNLLPRRNGIANIVRDRSNVHAF